MEKIIVVKSSEVLTGTKGEYLKVTTEEGKTQNIFDQAIWNLFGDGMAVKLHLEKQGDWWNVTSAESVAKALAEKAQAEKPVEERKPDSKNRAFALSYAKDVGVAQIQAGKDFKPRNLFALADAFTLYLDTGDFKEAIKLYNEIQLKKEE